MGRKLPRHCYSERSRHGKIKLVVRRGRGPRIAIKAPFDSVAFWAEYAAALEGVPAKSKSPKTHSLAWGLARYRESAKWRGFSQATRRQHEAIFRKVIETAGDELLTAITAKTIAAGRDRRAATPHSANNFLKAMRGFFGWAAGDGELVATDPTKGVKLLKGTNDDGFHTWTEGEVSKFEGKWPLGTRERLALDILLYTGFRRGDAVVLGRQHVRDGVISLRTEKTGEVVTIPLLPPLAASIAATETGDLAFLVTARGRPFVKESFGTWFRKAVKAAGCPGSAHGLRKAGAVRAALNGATVPQLMAMFGWSTEAMAIHYVRAADKAKLAAQGAQLLLPARSQNEKNPHLGSGAGFPSKTPNKSGA